MNNLSGVRDILPFLDFLTQKKVWFRLDQVSHDAIMVTLTLFGERIEVQFFDDHIEYSRFKGDESVERDVGLLFRLIADFVRE